MASPLTLTPSQTVGPFLHLALAETAKRFAVPAESAEAIRVAGTLTDGAGAPVPDGLVETWQADGLFARCPTDDEGHYEIYTRKPPASPTVDGTPQAPHLSVSIFARGLLDRVVTRIYFPEEDASNATDPTLLTVPAERRHLLVATAEADGQYRFDIVLQGDHESVFLVI
jgi:protocatechuate 3,4-dioxygenase alpha subunit